MPINTIITIIIGIFGAYITLISSFRAVHDSNLRKISDDAKRTVNELKTLVKAKDCPGAREATEAENRIPKLYITWCRAVSWPIWLFAFYIIAFTILFIAMKWPESGSGQSSSNELTDFMVLHYLCVKTLITIFLMYNMYCFCRAIYAQKTICSLYRKVEQSIETINAAMEKPKI